MHLGVDQGTWRVAFSHGDKIDYFIKCDMC